MYENYIKCIIFNTAQWVKNYCFSEHKKTPGYNFSNAKEQ